MPAKAKTLEKVAKKLGFEKIRQKGSGLSIFYLWIKT
jgi:predicted RNA binding protein YcfA (HicA-like mRNA interferase family)